jgi:hypothetical protein
MQRLFQRVRPARSLREKGNGIDARQEQPREKCCSESFSRPSTGPANLPRPPPPPFPLRRQSTLNEQVALAFLERLNAHESFGSLFQPKGDVCFPEAKMTVPDFQLEVNNVMLSFPDFRLDCTSDVQEQADGSVTVHVCGRGTHSGEPYGFGPFPAIPAKGVFCQNDPE